MTALDLLPQELRMVERIPADEGPEVEPHEEVVGVLDDDQIGLFSAVARLGEKVNPFSMIVEGPTPENVRAIAKINLLETLFWFEVRETFKVWDRSVGVRRGFQVVAWEDEQAR